MRTIYRYELPVLGKNWVTLPGRYKVLDAQMQNGKPCVWCVVQTDSGSSPVCFWVVGTGFDLDEFEVHGSYVATLQDGPYVWHVYCSEDYE